MTINLLSSIYSNISTGTIKPNLSEWTGNFLILYSNYSCKSITSCYLLSILTLSAILKNSSILLSSV